MLTQLSHLALNTDGRYATTEELQFLKDYLSGFNDRIKVYKKVRDTEAFLIEDLEEQTRSAGGNLYKGSKDVSDFFRRDQKYLLKIATASMLFNDLDFLREGELLWHRTIMKAVGCEQPSQVVCKVWPNVFLKYLSQDEWKFMSPVVGLIRAIFG